MFSTHRWRFACAVAATSVGVVNALAAPVAAQGPLAGCPVGGGGGGTSRGGYALIYAIASDSTGERLDAAVVVRAPLAWRRRPPPDSQPRPWSQDVIPRGLSGATTGPLWVTHERAANTIWLDSLPVPLHADNVLLLEVGADDAPRIVGRAHVEPRLPVSCSMPRNREQYEAFEQAIWTVVRRAAVVREFLDR